MPPYERRRGPRIVEFRNVSKTFPGGVQALRNVNLRLERGEFVVIVGLSGAGKSTLLRCVNRLVEPTTGTVQVGDREVTSLSEAGLRRWRTQVGMIFQNYNLVRRLTVLKNVLAGRLGHTSTLRSLTGMFTRADVALALRCLERVQMRDRAFSRADQLSGGQQQRVAIARALCQQPLMMLADEPVASLDPPTSHVVMRDLKRICRDDGITTLVNLHYIDLAMEYADRIIGMRSGEVVFDGPGGAVTEATFEEIYGRKIRPQDRRGGDQP